MTAIVCSSLVFSAAATRSDTAAVDADSLYNAGHPRLLFDRSTLRSIEARLSSNNRGAGAFAYACSLLQFVYPGYDNEQLLSHSYGVGTFPLLYVAGWLDSPQDTVAKNIGLRLTEHTRVKYEPDDNVYYAPLRLRALALGYDAFYGQAPDSIRSAVRTEMEAYIDTMLTTRAYEYWRYSPFLSNITTMIAAALGLGAICLDGETEPARVDAALRTADDYISRWLEHQLDPDGAYNEGAMYAGWCMRNLCYYFEARRRFDGYDYAAVGALKKIQNWVAYSLLPTGRAEVNNINDTATLNYPWSRHHTYFDWAQGRWGSGLAAWLWERLRGPSLGYDSGELADPAATILWDENVDPEPPGTRLPDRFWWVKRGLYYYRTGWPTAATSDDVVLSFYSGKFYGGHSQEDQNNFTLYGYGRRFAIDHGYGAPGRESEAHNIVLIDGRGQHHSGGSLGTDGKIVSCLLGDFADYVFGDATAAYTTYSEFNRPGHPFPENDWSPGYDGGNPVDYAHRRLVVAHAGDTPPYVVVLDDIDKDGGIHAYDWRLHTDDANAVDPASNPVRIGDATGWMDVHVVTPDLAGATVDTARYGNEHDDPEATVMSLRTTARVGRFVCLLTLGGESTPRPQVTHADLWWGQSILLEWPGDVVDRFVRNGGNDTLTVGDISTDARILLYRTRYGETGGYLAADVTRLNVRGRLLFCSGAPVGVTKKGVSITVDRPGVSFRVYAPTATTVTCRGEALPVRRDGAYLVTVDRIATPGRRVAVEAFPNPFNASVTVVVDILEAAETDVVVYDVAGRPVRTLWAGRMPAGSRPFVWDGRDDRSQPVASGVYFVRARSSGLESVEKLVLVK